MKSLEILANQVQIQRYDETDSEFRERVRAEMEIPQEIKDMRFSKDPVIIARQSTLWSDPDADPIADIEREVERQNMNKGLRPNPTSRQVAVYNTAQNTIHGHPQKCDGYCAPDECVCPFDEEE